MVEAADETTLWHNIYELLRYDPIRLVCHASGEFHATSISKEMIISTPVNYLFPIKLAIGLAALVASATMIVWDHRIWRTITFRPEGNPKKIVLPSLNNSMVQWSRFNFPNLKLGIAILLAITAFYQLGDGAIFFKIAQIDPRPSFGEVVAIAIAATAILFPLIILIVSYSPNASGGFSNPEVLLRHAYAFPLSLVLIALVGNMAFETHYFWAQTVSAITLLIAAFVMFRLLEAVFVPKAWTSTERKLLRLMVDGAIREIAEARIETNLTIQGIKSLSPFVTNWFSFLDRSEEKTRPVRTPRTGVVESINSEQLAKIVERLKTLTSDVSGTAGSTSRIGMPGPYGSADNRSPNFQIVLKVNPGDEITDQAEIIAMLHLEHPDRIDAPNLQETLNQIANCFAILSRGDHFQNREILARLVGRLGQMGRSAIKESNLYAIQNLGETFKELVRGIINAFKGQEIEYSLSQAKQETELFGLDWTPLTDLFAILRDFQEIALDASITDRRLQKEVFDLPFALAFIALRSGEQLAFSKLIQFAGYQDYLIHKNQLEDWRRKPIVWLLSLLENSVQVDLEKHIKDKEKQTSNLESARAIFESLLLLGKNTIDWAQKAEFDYILNVLNTYPELFRFEAIEQELKLAESILPAITENQQKIRQEATIQALKAKADLKAVFRDWRQEIDVGLGTYVLLQIDGKGSENRDGTPDMLIDFVQPPMTYLPQDLETLLRLQIRMNKTNIDDRWGWEFWEKIPTRFAKAIETPGYQKRFVALAFLRAASFLPEGFSIKGWNLAGIEEIDTYDFSNSPGTLRSTMESLLEFGRRCGITPSESQLQMLYKAFDDLRSKAKLNSELKLVRAPLSAEKIATAKRTFDEVFMRKANLRKLFPITINPDKVEPPNLGWGLNLLIQREFFADSEINFPDAGNHYAEGIGPSEDEFLFQEIFANGTLVEGGTIASLVNQISAAGVELSNAVILTSRDPYTMKLLRTDSNYRFNPERKGEASQPYPDAFYRVGEIEIPLYLVIMRNKDSKNGLIVCDLEAIEIAQFKVPEKEYLPRSGFAFNVTDPKDDTDFAEQVLKTNPTYLKDSPTEYRSEFVAKLIGLEILEKIKVVLRKTSRILVSPVEEENP